MCNSRRNIRIQRTQAHPYGPTLRSVTAGLTWVALFLQIGAGASKSYVSFAAQAAGLAAVFSLVLGGVLTTWLAVEAYNTNLEVKTKPLVHMVLGMFNIVSGWFVGLIGCLWLFP
jgi:hypothetical protein